MAVDSAFGALNFVAGAVAGVGFLYLLVTDAVVVTYGRFFLVITVGLFVFALTGPLVGTFEPAIIHAVHALAAACIAVGLAKLLEDSTQTDAFELAFDDP